MIFLSGCATTQDIPIVSANKTTINIDNEHFSPCDPLLKITPGDSELIITIKNIELYTKCKKKQDNSIILLKQLSNYEEVE